MEFYCPANFTLAEDDAVDGPVPIRKDFGSPLRDAARTVTDKKRPSLTNTISLETYRLPFGIIRVGDSLELKDKLRHNPNSLQSGDVIRVKAIVKNLATDEVSIKGLRFCRQKYFGRFYESRSLESSESMTEHD